MLDEYVVEVLRVTDSDEVIHRGNEIGRVPGFHENLVGAQYADDFVLSLYLDGYGFMSLSTADLSIKIFFDGRRTTLNGQQVDDDALRDSLLEYVRLDTAKQAKEIESRILHLIGDTDDRAL